MFAFIVLCAVTQILCKSFTGLLIHYADRCFDFVQISFSILIKVGYFVDTRSVGDGSMEVFMRNDNERMKDCFKARKIYAIFHTLFAHTAYV